MARPLARRLIGNLAGSWTAMAIRLPVTFLLTPFLIRSLGEERFGAFGVLISLLAYMNLAGGPLHSSIGRELAHTGSDPKARGRVLATAIAAASLLAVLTALVGFPLLGPLTRAMRVPIEFQADAIACFATLIGTVILSQALTPAIGLLMSRNRYDLVDLVEASGQVLYAVLAVLVFRLVDPSLARLGLANLAAQIVAGIVTVTLARRGGVETPLRLGAVDRSELRSLLGFSSQLFLINVSVLLTYQTDNIVIARLIGVAAVAHYAVAGSLILRFRQLCYGLSRTFMPATADPDTTPERLRALHLRGTRYMTLLVAGLGGVAFGLAEPFFALWLGESFRGSGFVFRILMAANLFGMSQFVTNAVLTGLRRTRALMVSEVLGALANLGLSIAFVRGGFGLPGVALGTLVPMVIRNVWLAVHGARVVGAPFAPYVTRVYGPAGIVFVVTAGALDFLARGGMLTSWGRLIAGGAFGLALFLALAWAMVLDREDRGRIRELVPAMRGRA
jgi:O-antigen/teichoic acid export membrane protein